jgi:hypothetical protein
LGWLAQVLGRCSTRSREVRLGPGLYKGALRQKRSLNEAEVQMLRGAAIHRCKRLNQCAT